ncbi:MAG: arginase family protein [Spirochaetia bacterium]|nr:arginase family protein [Spirochaetia bacterium]
MREIRESMDPLMEWKVPMLYPDTPTFLGIPLASSKEDLAGADVVVLGAPFQGAAGVARSYTNNLLTPVNLRKDSIKYSGYLPEYDVDVFDHLRVVDYGDAQVAVRSDTISAIESVKAKIKDVLEAGAVPIVIGGTEVGSSLPLAQALGECSEKGVGCITLDAHGDNMDEHGKEKYCGATWIARMSECEKIDMHNHVHIGMRGPRNFKAQTKWFASKGTRLITSLEVRKKEMDTVIEETVSRVSSNTDSLFYSIDFDVLDIGCAPGLDEPMGISVEELLFLSMALGKERKRKKHQGVSLGWLPTSDKPLHWIAVWTTVYYLAGMVMSTE